MKTRICLLFFFLFTLFGVSDGICEGPTTTLLLVRHGQSSKHKRKLQGHRNPLLTIQGKQQARKLARYLLNENITCDAVYCSDLTRAFKTAKILASTFHVELIKDKALRSKRRQSANYTQETTEEVLSRAKDFLSKIAHEHEGASIIVVSHASLISLLARHLDNTQAVDPSANSLDNCCIIEFHYDASASKNPFTLVNLSYPKTGKILNPTAK